MAKHWQNKNRTTQSEKVMPEIEVPVEEETTVVEETPVVVKEEIKTVTPPVTVSQPVNTTTGVSPLSSLELSLANYNTKMTANISNDEVAQVQLGFLRLLRGILNSNNQEEVSRKWNTVLNFANKNKEGAFSEYNLFKGAANWTGSQTEFNILRHLAWLIIQTANPKTRLNLNGSIDLSKVIVDMTETERNSLINFYS